jgi:hypothetical protein
LSRFSHNPPLEGSGRKESMTDLKLEDCVNLVCPWSGKPVSADSLAL